MNPLSSYIIMLALFPVAKSGDGREFVRRNGEEEVLMQIDHEQNIFTTFSRVFYYPKMVQKVQLCFCYTNNFLLLGCLPDTFFFPLFSFERRGQLR